MAISQELEAKILRYHFVELWGPHTIAAQLDVHHSVVDRVLSQAGMPKAERAPRTSIIDPYLPFIIETLAQYPRLTATRLYAMAQQRGYPGGASHFRSHVAQLRPRKPSEAYLRLRTLPGEQSQVDWGHFGYVQIGRAKRPLMAFVMVLSWSRQIFLRFYLNQRMESFLRGHVAAFNAWGALPRVLLYDNLKSAVLERREDAIRFHPTLLALSAHYHFEPRPVAVARGNEKGRVERAIRYIRDNFFAGRQWSELDDLNAQADAWCAGPAANRPCPEDRSMTVREAFAQEQPHLLALPDNPFETDERVAVSVGKTPYIRFDLNDYSVPHTQVRRSVTVMASRIRVRVLDGSEVIAEHPRVYGKGEQIENPAHLEALVSDKRAARHHRGQDRLAHAAPSSHALLQQAAHRGTPLSRVTAQLVQLLDDYGAAELEYAITEALKNDVPHP
ncbi:MAG TPA: IS21 family transposase, partial [Gammaproteobacteria bacterium]|nr:IS21 family transposase [Gammaproteobacteria bacterium]